MMADTQRPPGIMTKAEAAKYLGVSLVTIDKWIRQGKIRKGVAFIENRPRSVVNTEDVEKLKAERGSVQWHDGEE